MNKPSNLSKENKNLIINMIGSVGVKGVGLIISLFAMPAYIRFFNDDATLGLWFTILSILNWILYFDFGIGNGLRNYLSQSLAERDHNKSKKYISSAYIAIGLFCLVFSLIFFIISRFLNWHAILNIQINSVSEGALYKTVCIVFIGILLQMFFRLINSILYAIQKAAINNILGLITSILQVSAIYLIPSTNNDANLVIMAIIHIAAVILPLCLATIIVFLHRNYRNIVPSLKTFDIGYAKQVLFLGGRFLIAQLVYMIIMNTNEYLITLFVGSEWVVDYQIYYKLYTLAGTLFLLLLAPVWSAITKALAEKRYKWIKSLYHKILFWAFLCVLGVCCILPLAQFIVNIWLGDGAIKMSLIYGIAFVGLTAVIIYNSVLSTFSNGIGNLKVQIICFAIGAILKIPLAYIMVLLTKSWIGVVLANTIAVLLYCIVQPIFLKKYIAVEE